MELVGTIERGSDVTMCQSEWIRLIGAHPELSPVPDREGINPFSKQPMLYKARPDTARVLVGAADVGLIHWADDGSSRLVVWSNAGSKDAVRRVARDVASRLGWQFVAHDAA